MITSEKIGLVLFIFFAGTMAGLCMLYGIMSPTPIEEQTSIPPTYLASLKYDKKSETLNTIWEGKTEFAKVNLTFEKDEVKKMCKAIK